MIRVLYFSIVREALKKDYEDLNFSGTVKDLKELLKNMYPQVSELLDRVKFAVNEEYVEESFIISEGDKVAIIPPVSGG